MKKDNTKMLDILKKEFSNLGPEIRDRLRANYQQHIDEATEDEFFVGIDRAVCAMLEANVDDNKIIDLLIKYWDIKPSDAKYYFEFSKKYRE